MGGFDTIFRCEEGWVGGVGEKQVSGAKSRVLISKMRGLDLCDLHTFSD